MTTTKAASPNTSASSAVPLPPIVHAIGGSIGSALAILTFYPLERIRVEIQSQQQQQQSQKSSASTSRKDSFSDDKPKNNSQEGEKYTRKPDQAEDESSTTNNETIIQCLIRLHKEKSLYRGAKNMAMTLMISNFIFFYALQVTRKSLASYSTNNNHNHNHNSSSKSNRKRQRQHHRMSASLSSLLASTLAGVVNVLLTNPMWVASLRIMESRSILPSTNRHGNNNNNNNEANVIHHHQQTNLWNVMRQIANEEGPLQLWNGTFTSLLLVSNPIIQHFLYGQMRLRLLSLHHRHHWKGRRNASTTSLPSSLLSLTAVEAFVLGAISKMVATVVTYPLQLAQVLLRLQSKNNVTDSKEPNDDELIDKSSKKNTNAYDGMIDCLHQQFLKGGIRGLFQGMNAKLLSTVLTAAFTFLSYEQTLLSISLSLLPASVNEKVTPPLFQHTPTRVHLPFSPVMSWPRET